MTATAENTFLITQPIFGVREENGKKLVHHTCIINYGLDLGNGNIAFINKDGLQKQPISSFDSSIKLFKLKDICLENLMSDWKRINKEYGKPIVLDETIDTEERFSTDFSHLSIMVERRKDCIAIKPLFEKII